MNGDRNSSVRDSMSRMSVSDRPLEGTLVLGRYRILRALARGGMGMVYLGRIEGAAGFSKPVVVKRVLSHVEEGEHARQQFVREARILSNLSHPGIVGVIDFAEEGDSYLMVLEYVHGYQLGHWLKYLRAKERQIPWHLAVYVMIKVLRALHYAHTHKGPTGEPLEIIHRDISPGNILIDVGGNVRLLDFGIARSKGDTGEYKTQEGVLKGKLPYIAPELYHSADASVSSDTYACAVVLYQLLVGKNPFVGKGMSDTVNKVLKLVPDPASTKRPEVPKELDEILRAGMAKDPPQRYPNAQAFAEALYTLLDQGDSELQQELEGLVREDFTSDLPDALGLHRLEHLEEDWRAAAPDTDPSLLRASTPPPPPDEDAKAEAERNEMATAVMPADTAASLREEAARMLALAEEQTKVGPRQSGGMSARTLVLTILGAGVVAAGIAVGAVTMLGDNKPEKKERRFLVVDRAEDPTSSDTADEAKSADTAQEAAGNDAEESEPEAGRDAPAEKPGVPSPLSAGQASPKQKKGGVATLTATFSKRQGEVQGCFSRHADSLEGSPQLSVRFTVGKSGAVKSATLSPGAVASTALGSCILNIARTTQFAPREAPVAFSIPITARVVNE